MPDTEPPAPPPAPTPNLGEVELAALHQRVAESDQAVAIILRQKAELEADSRLKALGARLTPGMAKLAKPLLVELLATRTPATLKLQDDPAKPPADVAIADRILEILAAVPAVEALTAGRLAEQDHEAALATSGLSEERRRELDAKYRFTTNAFGFRTN